jgi:hypothetical protein
MRKFLVCLISLGFAASAMAELDPVAKAQLEIIRLGKDVPGQAIDDLLVRKTVTLPAGTVDAASLKAGTVLPAVNGAAVTNIQASSIYPAGVTKSYTNVVWNDGATTGTLVFVNGRLITP